RGGDRAGRHRGQAPHLLPPRAPVAADLLREDRFTRLRDLTPHERRPFRRRRAALPRRSAGRINPSEGTTSIGLLVLRQFVVDLGDRRALGEELVGLLDLLVDDSLEIVEGARTADAAAVDEQRGGAARLGLVGGLGVAVDLL